MATVVRSNLRPVLLAVQQRLMTRLGWGAERVRIAPPKVVGDNHPQGDAYLLLWVGSGRFNAACLDGGGRTDARLTRTLNVTVRTRCGLDPDADLGGWLVGEELGHADVEEQALDALLLFQPADTTEENEGDWLVTEPMRPELVGDPRPMANDADWGESLIQAQVTYELAVDQGEQ